MERKKNEPGELNSFQSRFLGILAAKKEEVQKALDLLMKRKEDYKRNDSESDFIEDLAQAERERTETTYYTLLERKNRELKKIEFLLHRVMKEEEFGFCEECGEKIPEERLLIIPEATLCVPCQRELEKMDTRRKWAETSRQASLGGKKALHWESVEDSNDDEGLAIQTDMGGLSFVDMDEIEIESVPPDKDETKNAPGPLERADNSPRELLGTL